jgi:hypothetical protein
MSAKSGDAFGVYLIKPSCPGFLIHHQPRILEHLEVLGDCRTSDRQQTRKLIHGQRATRELLENGHARRIGESIQAGL